MAARARKATSTTNKVDETVVNQENPVVSETERESTNPEPEVAEVPKMAPANKVDDTVLNQENPGAGTFVDRNPDPVILEDSAGVKFDVSKPYPQLLDETTEEEKRRKAFVRQNEGALNAKDFRTEESDHDHIEIEFLESGFTVSNRVWKKGQVLTLEDNEDARRMNADNDGNLWFDQSANEQEKRYGKVFFEKR